MGSGAFNKAVLILALLLVSLNIFSGYVNSWFINFPIPSIGSVLRDFTLLLLMAMVLVHALLVKRGIPYLVVVWSICVLYVSLLIPFAPHILYALQGIRNIFYPFAGIVFIYFSFSHKSEFRFFPILSLWMRNLLFIAAALGVLDFATAGEFIYALGFNPEYNDLVALMVRHHLGVTRANAGISDALNYGYLMAFSSVYALYLIGNNKRQGCPPIQSTIFLHMFFMLSVVACVFSMTRGAIISVVVAIFLHNVMRRSFLPLLVIPLLAFYAVQMAPQTLDLSGILFDRFSENDSGSQVSSQQRVDAGMRSMDIISSNPLLGAGLGTQGAPSYFDTDDRRVATDNSFLWILLDTGVVGFLIVFFSYFSLFRYLYRTKTDSNYKELVVLSSTIIFIAASLSSAPLSPTFAITFWVLLVSEAQSAKT